MNTLDLMVVAFISLSFPLKMETDWNLKVDDISYWLYWIYYTYINMNKKITPNWLFLYFAFWSSFGAFLVGGSRSLATFFRTSLWLFSRCTIGMISVRNNFFRHFYNASTPHKQMVPLSWIENVSPIVALLWLKIHVQAAPWQWTQTDVRRCTWIG